MRKRRAGRVFAILGLCLGLAALLIYGWFQGGRNMPAYTAFSTADDGVALLYDALGVYGLPVDISYNEIRPGISLRDAQIIVEPDYQYMDWDRIDDWVNMGGRLVIIEQSIHTYKDYGMGDIVYLDVNALTNKALMGDTAAGAYLAGVLKGWRCDRVLFNEYYHGYGGDGLWKSLPTAWKLAAAEFAVAAVFFVLCFGKLFARPVPYYEEVERGEGEHILAVSNLYAYYRDARIPAESLWAELIRRCSGYFNESAETCRQRQWELWTGAALPVPRGFEDAAAYIGGKQLDKNGQKRVMKAICAALDIIEYKSRNL